VMSAPRQGSDRRNELNTRLRAAEEARARYGTRTPQPGGSLSGPWWCSRRDGGRRLRQQAVAHRSQVTSAQLQVSTSLPVG